MHLMVCFVLAIFNQFENVRRKEYKNVWVMLITPTRGEGHVINLKNT